MTPGPADPDQVDPEPLDPCGAGGLYEQLMLSSAEKWETLDPDREDENDPALDPAEIA